MMCGGDMRSRAFLMCISRRGREQRRASVSSLRADRTTMVPEITTSLCGQSSSCAEVSTNNSFPTSAAGPAGGVRRILVQLAFQVLAKAISDETVLYVGLYAVSV
jgi:hypothetical protein